MDVNNVLNGIKVSNNHTPSVVNTHTHTHTKYWYFEYFLMLHCFKVYFYSSQVSSLILYSNY